MAAETHTNLDALNKDRADRPDAELIRLGEALAPLVARLHALDDISGLAVDNLVLANRTRATGTTLEELMVAQRLQEKASEATSDSFDMVEAIIGKIEALHAHSIEGLVVKARAFAAVRYVALPDLARQVKDDDDITGADRLASLLSDIIRLGSPEAGTVAA